MRLSRYTWTLSILRCFPLRLRSEYHLPHCHITVESFPDNGATVKAKYERVQEPKEAEASGSYKIAP